MPTENFRPTPKQADQLDALGNTLNKKAATQVSLRVEVEDRWLQDLRQYNGQYDTETLKKLEDEQKKTGASSIFANITRTKTDAGEARLSDMLLPVDQPNWGIEPTPIADSVLFNDAVAELNGAPLLDEAGNPLTVSQAAQREHESARLSAKEMSKEIDDQLIEAHYNAKARDVIKSAAMLGTGIAKGPITINRTRKQWSKLDGAVHELNIITDHRPSVEVVDPFDFFPDMTASTICEAEFTFERKLLTRKMLRNLMKAPGYIRPQIKKVLETDPREGKTHSSDYISRLREISGITNTPNDDNRYELWEYHGPVSREDMEAAGIDFPFPEESSIDEIEAVVLFVGTIVIKVDIHPLETEECIYSIFNWIEDHSTVFGYGVPHLMRDPQKVMNAAMRMMLDNAALNVGPQVVLNPNKVEPMDGQWGLSTRKVWMTKDSVADVRSVMTTYNIESTQEELFAIYNLARQLADEESNLPQIAQGEGSQTDTARGMTLLMNQANTVMRRLVKSYDDNITTPLITRFYDYNMQFSENVAIKGDMEVKARGSSALLVREAQTAFLLQLLGFVDHPKIGPMIKEHDLLKKIIEAQHMSPNDIVKSEADLQVEAQANQPEPDPRVMLEAGRLELDKQKFVAGEKDKDEERQLELIKAAESSKQREADRNLQRNSQLLAEKSKQQMFVAEAEIKERHGTGI